MKIIKMNDKKNKKMNGTWIMLRETYTDDDEIFHYAFVTIKDKDNIFDYYKDEKDYIEFIDADGDKCIVSKKDIVAIHK